MLRIDKLIGLCVLSFLLSACGGGAAGTSTPALNISYESSTPSKDIPSDCVAQACDVTGSTTFKDSRALVMAYRNTSDSAVAMDINFTDLRQGQEITYVFSSGQNQDGSYEPTPGNSVYAPGATPSTSDLVGSVPATRAIAPAVESHDDWHLSMDAARASAFAKLSPAGAASGPSFSSSPASSASATQLVVGPDVSRDWYEPQSKQIISATVQSTCLAGQRQVVFWADDKAAGSADIDEQVGDLSSTLCGGSGGITRLQALLGSVWGQHTRSNLITESVNSLLDINVLLVSAGAKAAWGGYFSSDNSFTKSTVPTSNEALVFYVNADLLTTNLPFVRSTLIHEATHMINWYQRNVFLNLRTHDTWLEEMTALMSEDIVSPTVVEDVNGAPYNNIVTYRLQSYLSSGGGLNLVRWASLSKAGPHYGMAGGFGAYLNRRYGLELYRQLMTACTNANASSWDCLDGLIKKLGGNSAAEEFYQYGATVFSLGTLNAPSARFSFPATNTGGYRLSVVDLSKYAAYRLPSAKPIYSWQATSHTYLIEKVNFNIFGVKRRGVQVPPKSYLTVSVR